MIYDSYHMSHITWIMSHYFEKSDSDSAFQQSKTLILHLVCSHLPDPGFERPRHCVKYNGTRLIDENYMNVLIRVSMRNENIWGHFCQKPYGSILQELWKIYTGPMVDFTHRNEENHKLTHKNLYRCRWCLLGCHSQWFFL